MLMAGVTDKEVMECRNAKAALRMTLDRSGRSHKALALDLGITESHLSRALSVEYDVNLPQHQLVPFMASCGNIIYLRWLFLRLVEMMPSLVDPLDDGLSGRVDLVRRELTELIGVVKERGRKDVNCPECGAQFALTEDSGVFLHNFVDAARLLELEAIYAGVLGGGLVYEVLSSAAGFYIGRLEDGMPYSRDSKEYWRTLEEAEKALATGEWTRRGQC